MTSATFSAERITHAGAPHAYFERPADTAPCRPVRPALRRRAQRILDQEIEFVPCRSFAYTHPDREPLDLCPVDRLTAERERALFRRMNFHKYQASVLRGMLQLDRPSERLMDLLDAHVERATEIRNYVVQVFLKLAHSVARQVVNDGSVLDDLVSEAHATLLRAAEKFDVDRGFRFSTYATHAIRRNLWRLIKLRQRDAQRLVLVPTLLRVTENGPWSPAYEHQMSEAVRQINGMLGDLEPREQLIVRSRFGLGDELVAPTLKELSERLGISRERIRQLQHRALAKLRVMATQRKVEPPPTETERSRRG